MTDVQYDAHGRMKYHPDIHAKQGLPWMWQDEKYLIDHYETVGPAELSFALERTIGTIMSRAYELRKKGLMPKRKTKKIFRRWKEKRA